MAKYSVEFKKKVLRYYKKNGITKTCRKFSMVDNVIYRWKRKEETVGFMRKKNKSYSKEEKIAILEYMWKNGYSETERKFDVNSGLVNKWERLYREHGLEGLAYDGRGRKPSSLGTKKDISKDEDLLEELQRLRIENMYLKKLDALVQEREERGVKKKRK